MNTYKIMKDRRPVGELQGHDARQIAELAVEKWGNGMYDISLVRPKVCAVCDEPLELGHLDGVCVRCQDVEDDGEQ